MNRILACLLFSIGIPCLSVSSVQAASIFVDAAAIPEPTMFMLMGLALIGIVVFHRRDAIFRKQPPRD